MEFAADTLRWYGEGRTIDWMVKESERLGRKLSTAAISRHKRHLEEGQDEPVDPETGEVNHLEVLQRIIKQGAKRSHTWRVGPAETMKAMEMYYRLTQGSVMQDLFGALTAAASGETPDESDGTVDAGSFAPVELESADADGG